MKTVLFAAHDVGGGNAIMPLVHALSGRQGYAVRCLIGGPSKALFHKEGIPYVDADALDMKTLLARAKKDRPDILVSGTSAQTAFEKKLIPPLRNAGVKTIAVLDFWAHYRERFSSPRKPLAYMPDVICVPDVRARREMIADGFPSSRLAITGNPYFDSFSKMRNKKAEQRRTILFVSQPTSDRVKEFGFQEFRVLEDLLAATRDLKGDYTVVIRPHPKEAEGKFKSYRAKDVVIDESSPIEKLLARAGLVVGMNSMVLYQAAVAGKKVISYQPGLKTQDYLPSNAAGLSRLARNRKQFIGLMNQYARGTFPAKRVSRKSALVPHATQNIINLIKQYEEKR
ncbi:MAG: CDP-glycerol glycerophosphotransferase family protein [Patescibacteria group bacterium]|nr:CDP-glycerol glycerophosphotransferase family protein [Patescibacteria group bacterium]